MFVLLFFFFSSRRRHTRLQGDWSSDVCSSDLDANAPYRSLTVPQLKELLHDAGVNLSNINFSGAVTCTVDRSDVAVDEKDRSEERRVGKECRCRWWTDR